MEAETMASTPILLPIVRPVNCEVYKGDIYKPRHYILKWKIENFLDVDHKVISGIDDWFIIIPGAKTDESMYRDRDSIVFYFGHMTDSTTEPVLSKKCERKHYVKGNLAILSSLGKLHCSKTFKFEYNKNEECISDKIELSATRAELKMAKSLLLPNHVLTIHCEFVTYSMNFRWEVENLSIELNELLRGERFADIAICTSQEVISAHKCILVARSPVLAQRIEHSSDNSVDLSDMEPTVAKALITYLYTGNPDWIIDDLSLDALKQIPDAAKQLGLLVLETFLENYRRQNWYIPHSAVQENLNVKWNIKGFEMEPNMCVESSWFKIAQKTRFRLVLYKKSYNFYLGIEMLIADPSVNFELKISILSDDDSGVELCKVDKDTVKKLIDLYLVDDASTVPQHTKISLSFPIDSSDLTELLHFSSTSKLQCSIIHGSSVKKCHNCCEVVTVNKHVNYPSNHFEILSRDMEELLQSQRCSDFVIQVQGHHVPCHIAIFTTRFHLSFEHRLGSISLDADTDFFTFEVALGFLYSGKMDLTPQNAAGVFELASKYGIVQMKRKSSMYLVDNLSISNVCRMFGLAKECFDADLEMAARMLMSKNYEEVSRGKNWENLKAKYTTLENDVLSSTSSETSLENDALSSTS